MKQTRNFIKRTALEHSTVAKNYYQEAVPSGSFGMEKYVATDGENTMFVISDYQPEPGESVFYIKRTRNGLSCQLYRAARRLYVGDGESQSDEPLYYVALRGKDGKKTAYLSSPMGLVFELSKAAFFDRKEDAEALIEVSKRKGILGIIGDFRDAAVCSDGLTE